MSISKILMTINMIGMLIIPVGVHAQISSPNLNEIRELAYAHDFQTLEILLDQLQEDVLAGRVSYDDQRRAYTELSRLHPDLVEAVLAWRKKIPESNHARAARIWMLYSAGWRMRGEDYPRWIYPEALSEFQKMHRTALKLAKTGFDLQPDFIPISDAILQLQLTVRSEPSIWDFLPKDTPFERIMKLTPNRGSLMKQMSLTQPQWGGSFAEVVEICENYAPLIKDVEGYSAEICMADTIYFNNYQSSELLRWAQEVLDATNTPILEHARWLDAVRDRPFLEPARAQRSKNLDTLGYRDLITAIRYDVNYANPRYLPKLAPKLYLLLHERALKELEFDPYNPAVLKVLMKVQLGGTPIKSGPDWAEIEEYHHRKIASSPFSAEMWGDLASLINVRIQNRQELSETALKHLDDFYINAIIYSNYKPENLWIFQQQKFSQLQEVMPTFNLHGDVRHFSASEMDEQNETLICPFIRIHRIKDAVCSGGVSQDSCGPGPGLEPYNARIFEIAYERNTCEKELNAPSEELMFTPVEFDWARYPFQ